MFEEFFPWANQYIDQDITVERVLEGKLYNRREIEKAFLSFNFAYFYNRAEHEFDQDMAPHLVFMCCASVQDYTEPLYFPDLVPCMLDYMDAHAKDMLSRLGKTKVSEEVFFHLKFGRKSKTPVMILGDARVGKTTSVRIWSDMQPGLVRLVTVPDNPLDWEFYQTHAEALGIDHSETMSVRNLRRKVEYVLRHSGLYIVYDESHFLLPVVCKRNTAPKRINWVRCQVIDRKLGAAFFATRQTYHQALDRFAKVTKHQMEQWFGRVLMPLVLKSDFDQVEILAAAKAKHPDMDSDLLEFIVCECIKTETGFQFLDGIVEYTRFVAEESGRPQPTLEDIQAAFDKLLYSTQANDQKPPQERQADGKSRRFREDCAANSRGHGGCRSG